MRYRIDIKEHKKTKLLMATIDEVPGFIVHAHDEDELRNKLADAFEQFMNATDQPVTGVHLIDETAPGFWPPAFVAEAESKRAA